MLKNDIIRELKILRLDLQEIRAYRSLQTKIFDFGDGDIIVSSAISEDAYFKREENNIKDAISALEYVLLNFTVETNTTNGINRHKRKQIRESKLQKLLDEGAYFIGTSISDEGKEYLKRYYVSGIRKESKRQTNKAIRNSRNDFKLSGSGYRKKFDYFNNIY